METNELLLARASALTTGVVLLMSNVKNFVYLAIAMGKGVSSFTSSDVNSFLILNQPWRINVLDVGIFRPPPRTMVSFRLFAARVVNPLVRRSLPCSAVAWRRRLRKRLARVSEDFLGDTPTNRERTTLCNF